MRTKQIVFELEEYDSEKALTAEDALLLEKARQVTQQAYAPYSGFLVGAAAILADGSVITGTNQENASYPVGICAERVLLSTAGALQPGVVINTIAIAYNNTHGSSNNPVSPCGLCRQSLVEYETRVQHPIRLILSGMEGRIFIIPKASSLLPLSFTKDDMQ